MVKILQQIDRRLRRPVCKDGVEVGFEPAVEIKGVTVDKKITLTISFREFAVCSSRKSYSIRRLSCQVS